jgi:hypothetical protein
MVPKGSPEVSVGPRKQVHRRLRPAEIEELVAGYQAGATACQLADRFRIHRTTVLSLLERQSVTRRNRRLSSTEINQARELYAAGQSLAKVGKQLGCHASTVRLVLLKAGVRMRDCQSGALASILGKPCRDAQERSEATPVCGSPARGGASGGRVV